VNAGIGERLMLAIRATGRRRSELPKTSSRTASTLLVVDETARNGVPARRQKIMAWKRPAMTP
jgi:hypothetical protein